MRSLLTAACLAFAAPALADVTLAYQDAEGKPAMALYVKGHMVRMETGDDDGGVILFNTQNDDITVLQPRQREYIVLDRATLETIQQQMRQAMQMMERFGMDPAQMGLGKTRVEARHVRTGETRTVAGHRCDVVRTEIDGGRPLGVRIGWSGGGGHFVIVEGYKPCPEQRVAIDDPWYGASDLTYNAFVSSYQGTGSWTHSYTTES
jgi:hypothetical protein